MEEENIMQEEPHKKKLRRGTVPKLILATLMFVAGITLIVLSLRYDGEEVAKPAENNTTDTNDDISIIGPSEQTIYENVYIFNKELVSEGKQNYDILILRNDSTFVYNYDSAFSSTPIVGSYTVDENNKISFEEKISYGTDNCFYTEGINFRKYTGTKSDDKLIIQNGDESMEFINTYIPNGDAPIYLTDSWYSINPASGVRPEGTTYGNEDDTWLNCNNIEN